MKRTLVALCLLVIGAVGISPAAQPDRPLMIYGEGLRSCSQWLKVGGDKEPVSRVERLAMASWVGGFVTAAGFYGERELPKTDGAAIEAYIDQYCSQSPLHQLHQAAVALVYELVKR